MAPDPRERLVPKRSLGQNFLVDRNIAKKIVNAVRPEPGDTFIEIGPGQGALTRFLHGSVRRLILVELDQRAVDLLKEQFTGESVEILREDFLQFDLHAAARRCASTLRVIGNIPYNITSPILFHLLDNSRSVKDVTLMLQREVARRITAEPGSREYGIPSVFCRYYGTVTKLFDVPPTVFVPKPEVWSSVIRIEMLPEPSFRAIDEGFFRSMVRAVFGQRRKMLRHSLRNYLEGAVPDLGNEVDLRKRPESLSTEELVHLSNLLFDRRRIV